MNKKIIAYGVIAASLVTSSFAADITYYGLSDGYSKINSINFSDVLNQGEGYWAKPAIYQIASFGIMSGFSSTAFSPTSAVTNEQAVTTILNAKGKAADVDNLKMVVNNWSDKYIKYAMNEGIITEKIVYKKDDIKGDVNTFKDKGVFVRDIPITREEVATLIYRAFSLPTVSSDGTKKPVEFLDKSLIDSSRVSHVDAVSLAGIMVGDEAGMFNPQSNLTRAEFAQILKNCEDYLLGDLRLTKRSGFVDSVNGTGLEITDDNGNTIFVDCSGRDIPVIRGNALGGVSRLKNSDEIEFFVDTSKQVVFIRVIDEGIYEENKSSEPESTSKQGIVTGNSPYFYEIAIKDKNGNVEKYSYGSWTEIYKDGKETNANDILQGDTVYLEFDEIGDLVVIRGVTNAVISYGTITNVSGYNVSLKMDSDGLIKEYNLKRIPVYENGEEIDVADLYSGKYVKLYSSQSEVIKAEIVFDERTAENLYKGYISEINLIQDRIILRNPKVFKDGAWESAESSFITIPLDSDMEVVFDGESIKKSDLGEKHAGKYAYIATREDTKVLEKVKAINIEFGKDSDTIEGEIRSYSDNSGVLKLYNNSKRLYINESTICVIDGKIVSPSNLEKGDSVSVTVSYEDDEYFAKMIVSVNQVEEKEVTVYYGSINDVEAGAEISLKVNSMFEDDEWSTLKRKYITFEITDSTRIFSESEPLTFKEFDSSYEDEKACIIAYGDKAVSIGIMDLGEDNPYISVGSIKEVGDSAVVVCDVEYYDFEEEEWLESVENESVGIAVNTLISVNGNFSKSSGLKKGQEVVIIRKDATSSAGVILAND